jgi:hypothetical protein
MVRFHLAPRVTQWLLSVENTAGGHLLYPRRRPGCGGCSSHGRGTISGVGDSSFLRCVGGSSSVLKKLLIIAGVIGAAALVVKKVKASSDERALWHEATTAPDLR